MSDADYLYHVHSFVTFAVVAYYYSNWRKSRKNRAEDRINSLSKCSVTRVGLSLLIGVLLSGTPPVPVFANDEACTPQACAGLQTWQGTKNLIAEVVADRNAARLAYSIGLSLLEEECCYKDAVGYLRYALDNEPALEAVFFEYMNRPAAGTWGVWTRIIGPVSRHNSAPNRF